MEGCVRGGGACAPLCVVVLPGGFVFGISIYRRSTLNVNDEVPTARGNYVWFPASSLEDGGAVVMAFYAALI